MRPSVTIVYNEPAKGRYHAIGESRAEEGVLDEVRAGEMALRELGYPVFLLPLRSPLEEASLRIKGVKSDVIFNLFEGFGDDPSSEAAGAFELARTGIPCTGCPGSAISLAQDKIKALERLKGAAIPVPEYQVLSPGNLHGFKLPFPCIVKPVAEHASHGLSARSVVRDEGALEREVRRVSDLYGGSALVEVFTPGREFNATVMGNRKLTILPPSEIVYNLPAGIPRILTFAAKWEEASDYFRGTKAVSPAPVTSDERENITEISLRVYTLFGCRGYGRVDMRQDGKGALRVIDVNPNPDISPEAGASRQAKAAGMTYRDFIEKIILLALEGD